MKILYLGEISQGKTACMRMRALERVGHEVVGLNTVQPWREACRLRRQWQRRLACGSVVNGVNGVNETVIETARDLRPDLVWADKQEFLRAETVEGLRRLWAKTIHFTPDSYFLLSWKRTSLMNEAMRSFDLLAYCRIHEKSDYEALGKPLVYLPLGYCHEVHRPLPSTDPSWSCAVGFLGRWEPRREALLRAVAKTIALGGGELKICGGYWEFLANGKVTLRRRLILKQLAGKETFAIRRDPRLARCLRGGEVHGDDYARALTGSRIGFGFLRKVCPDQHTTRTFEIRARGSMLLADRTDEHRALFEEGKEPEILREESELVDKEKFYIACEGARARAAAAPQSGLAGS